MQVSSRGELSLKRHGVNNVYCRYYVVDNTEDTIINFQADRSSGGAVEDGTLEVRQVPHATGSNTIDLRFQATAANKEYIVRLSAGESYLLFLTKSTLSLTRQALVGPLVVVSLTLLKPFALQLMAHL